MNTSVHILLLLLRLLRHLEAHQDLVMSELPFSELLAQKRMLKGVSGGEEGPVALAFVGEPAQEKTRFKELHQPPSRKTFYEDYEEEKSHVPKKKEKDKLHDVLNTSIMALSYLAFGGYLLCMICSALREKRRRYSYTTAAPTTSHLAQVLQQYMNHRPLRPFIRFPAVTLHQGGKKRRRRRAQRDATEDGPSLISVVDFVEILPSGSR